jgi:hypothetical protein
MGEVSMYGYLPLIGDLDVIECVGDNVVLSRDVSYVGSKRGDEVEVIELPR